MLMCHNRRHGGEEYKSRSMHSESDKGRCIHSKIDSVPVTFLCLSLL